MLTGGFQFLKKDKVVLSFVIFIAIINFSFVPISVLQPVFVDEVMKMGAMGMSYFGGAILLGMLAGGILVGSIGKKLKPIKTAVLSFVVIGSSYALLGIVGYLNIVQPLKLAGVMTMLFLLGMMLPIAQSALVGTIMKRIPSGVIGRVMSILTLISVSMNPLGGTLVGAIGDKISISHFFITMGALGIICSLLFGIYHRNTILDTPPEVEKTA
jgi:DHA3 family macrolide efflux protein-like MFS transporter